METLNSTSHSDTMAIIEYPEILFLLLCFIVLCYWRSSILINWPLVGMLPGLIRVANNLLEIATEVLKQYGGTFEFKGPWFANMDMLITADPANIHHILSRNFSNYPKGPEFKMIFEMFGDGILNTDSEVWEAHRKTALPMMNHEKFRNLIERSSWQKVKEGLIPVLDRISGLGTEVDLQGLLQRFTFDTICMIVAGHDPGSLSIALPHIPCEKAFFDAEEAIFYRHILPESLWKLQKWLQIGREKKLSNALLDIDQFVNQRISMKREESESKAKMVEHQEEGFDLLSGFMKAYTGKNGSSGDCVKFLRDNLMNMLFAGKGSVSAALTWFFWLIATNPLAENKIREEMKAKLHVKEDDKWSFFNVEESRKLVYLHGALCESLRLFPPVFIEHKTPLQPDILPSGHRVDPNSRVLLSFYSIGRMETVWGEDCLEFKPERWISARGGIKHEPSFKFPTFNAGPRSCLGKQLAFIEMKIVASTIIHNYHIQVAEGHPISPRSSMLLHMKHGLKVRITKRSV
ncbi:alkane hydroxylase MAH1-like [Cornus florida]|uniref:alkane hydroxylase MAH1-like n=1 Tax=Cornus florida TaxID=4283 RepID=UPI00289E20D8|nr:alkane hydroxylase MAH1-like [Cornus florida]